ncbi:MAG TPA: hypothetical protein V6D22_01205 [Candidatus Obscuribacterales bacterium]
MSIEHDLRANKPSIDATASHENIDAEAKRIVNLADRGNFHHVAAALRADSKLPPEQRHQFFQALQSESATGHHVHPLTITGLDENAGVQVMFKNHGKNQFLFRGHADARNTATDPGQRAQSAIDGRFSTLPLQNGEGPFQYLMRTNPNMDGHTASVMARQLRDQSGKTIFKAGDRLPTLPVGERQEAIAKETKRLEAQDRKQRIESAVDRFRANPAHNEVPKFGELLGLKDVQTKAILDAQHNDAKYKGKLFGDIAIEKGFITADQQHTAENLQRDLRSEQAVAKFKEDPGKEPPTVPQILGLAPFETKKAEALAVTQQKPISDVIVDLGYRTKEQVANAFQTAGTLQKQHLDKVGD